MTVNFYLNIKPGADEHTIFMYIRGVGGTIKYHTGETISQQHWDSKKQVVKKSYTGSPELNLFLSQLKERVWSVYRVLISENTNVSFSHIKRAIFDILKQKEPIPQDEEILSIYDKFIKVKTDSGKISPRTIQKYSTLKDHLKLFAKKRKFDLVFDAIDMIFYDELISFFIKEQEMTNNTIGKYVSTFKTFMHWATERGYNSKQDFIKFEVLNEQSDMIYLTWDELMKLYNHDFKELPHLAKVRDVFCFQCFTGQRFSDISNITRNNIRGKSWFLRTMKTRAPLEIPLNDYALSILEKYKDEEKPLPIISHQKTNDQIKLACEKAGINDIITVIKYVGTKRYESILPKHKLVSTHDGRRSFVTLSLQKGMRAETVMEITGHKDYKTMKKYLKIVSEVKRKEMDSVWNLANGEQ